MLKEIPSAQNALNGQYRRWFTSEVFDLFVFFNDDRTLSQFQLSYDKKDSEHVISWSERTGYCHNRIDDGEGMPGRLRSPIFVSDGFCDIDRVKKSFLESSLNLEDELFDELYKKLIGFKYGFEW